MSRSTSLTIAAAAMLLVASPLAAQTPTMAPRALDISAGYQLLHIPDETFPFGLNFDVSGQLMPSIRAVGEFGFAKDTQTEPGVSGTLHFYNIAGGPRWTRPMSSYTPFVQILAGAVRTDADLVQNGVPFNAGVWAFMLQPGVGVVVPVAPGWGVVGQVDYRRAFFSPESENEFRIFAGVRIGMP